MIDGVNRGGPLRPAPLAAEAISRPKGGDIGVVGGAKPVPAATEAALGQVAKDIAATPPIDAAKVERLRTAIESGSYKPDPQAIATAMLALEAGSAKR